jgi:hypothetical protein
MAKKRGGIAGFYDRNKGAIKTIAPIAAGFIPGVGPAIGAALGAALGGDREGKGYFGGFDVGGAVQGGLSGYGGAKLGQAAKGGLAKMFTGGVSPVDKLTGAPKMGVMTQTTGPAGAVQSLGGAPSVGVTPFYSPNQIEHLKRLDSLNAATMPGPVTSAADYGNIPAPQMRTMPNIQSPPPSNPIVRAARSVAGKVPSTLKSKEGLAFAGNALQTGASIMGSQAQAAQQEREYEEQQRRMQAQAEMMALFAPQMARNLGMSNFGSQVGSINASGRGTPAMTMQNYMDSSGANATEEEFGPEMMNYVNSRRGQPAGPSQGLMNYVNSRR